MKGLKYDFDRHCFHVIVRLSGSVFVARCGIPISHIRGEDFDVMKASKGVAGCTGCVNAQI